MNGHVLMGWDGLQYDHAYVDL